jgi:hypothetical protein
MNQFGYRPPSAGRSLIRNSQQKDDEEDKIEDKIEEEEIEENLLILKKLIREILISQASKKG